jgi:preprotein translocase subunit SecG
MKTVLIVALVVLWCAFMASVLMMSPKWGIGLWIGGASAGWNEYGSKKSIEWKLKIFAMISGILFVGICVFLPFVD